MNGNIISAEMFSDFLGAEKINADNLNRIIFDNSGTEFGNRHGFLGITNIDDYRKSVPLSDYFDFAESIERMRAGERNVLTVYDPVSFCRTSGSTGEPKYIPISNTALERYSDAIERYKDRFVREKGGKRLLVSFFRTIPDKPLADEVLLSEAYYRRLYLSGSMDMSGYAGGIDTIFTAGERDILYAKLWCALAEKNIILFEALFLYEILSFFSYFKDNWKAILHDMRAGKIPGTVRLSDKIKAYLLLQKLSPERLDEIERECAKGFDCIAGRLWNTGLVSGIGNSSAFSEEAALKFYTGNIPLHYYGYCASECFIGLSAEINRCRYALLPRNAFFEFLPEDGKGCGTVLPHEVTVGAEYEPVITNFSGLYRYRMGDVVRITGMVGKCPLMEFARRKGQVLNIAGEKYSVVQLEKAVYRLRQLGINTENYYIGVSLCGIPGKYAAVITYDGGRDAPAENEAARKLDEALMEYNRDYADLRRLEQIDRPAVYLCTNREFAEFMEKSGYKPENAHEKPRHIANKEVSETEWKKLLQRN